MINKSFPIALVAPLPPPAGGMANQAHLLFNYLKNDNQKVYFIRTNDDYRPDWIKNIKVVRAFFRLMFYLYSVWSVAGKVRLFHVLSNSGWSWFLFSMPVLIIAKMRGVPVLINYRGGEADAFFERSWRWIYPSLKQAANITVPTLFLHSVFKKRGINTNIVPNLVDLDLFEPKGEYQISSEPHFIVTRNLEKIYGNDIAIKSFHILEKKYPGARMTIAGTGPEKESLLQLVKKYQLENKVTFTGSLERKEMAALYQSADIMLNASRVDNTPNSIIEALASGVIVVSSSVGGIPWLVKHKKTAILTDKNTPEELALSVELTLSDKVLRNKLQVNGYKLAEQFAWISVKEKLYKNYQIAIRR